MLGIFYCRVESILALDLRPISEHESHILALDLDLDPSPVSYPGSRPYFYTYILELNIQPGSYTYIPDLDHRPGS